MKLDELRKHKKRSRWAEGLFSRNPVLVCGLALPFAVMVTNNLKNSATISILLACSLLPTVLLAALIGGRLPQWLSTAVYALFSMLLVVSCLPLVTAISPEVGDSLGIYVPILSINTVMLTLCQRYSRPHRRPVLALCDGLSYSLGFALAMGAVAALRELLGNNTLWGVPVRMPFKASGLQIAFAGFLIVALLAALLRFLRRLALLWLYRRENPRQGRPAAQ